MLRNPIKMKLDYMLLARAAQGVHALVVIILASYVAHWYNTAIFISSPSEVNFLIFLPIFSMFSLIYLVLAPRLLPKASHPFVHLVVDALNALFYFAGFIALAVFISRLLFCLDSVCAAARGTSAFAAFSWLLWTGTTAMSVMKMMRGTSASSRVNKEKTNHPMSQNPLPPLP